MYVPVKLSSAFCAIDAVVPDALLNTWLQFVKSTVALSVGSVGELVSHSEQIATAQTLLWSRLLPNASYSMGVIAGLLVAALPLVVFLILICCF